MKIFFTNTLIIFILPFSAFCQIVPVNTNYNHGIYGKMFYKWSNRKVNRGLVDSDSNCAVIFMPPNMSQEYIKSMASMGN